MLPAVIIGLVLAWCAWQYAKGYIDERRRPSADGPMTINDYRVFRETMEGDFIALTGHVDMGYWCGLCRTNVSVSGEDVKVVSAKWAIAVAEHQRQHLHQRL